MANVPFNDQMMVVKFGGSSIADSDKISHAAKLVADKAKDGKKIIVIISAIGKTTDELVKLANGSASKATPKQMDEVLAMGERTSCRVFNVALASFGINSDFLDVDDEDWPIITDASHGSANIVLELTKERLANSVSRKMENLDVLVIPGFIGRSTDGHVTTIGRGGSDATTYVVADALNIRDVILVSDVSGIMSADPKVVKNPKKIERIDVSQLVGLADSGVKFMHKKALGYKPKDIDVKIINNTSNSLDESGTMITGGVLDIEVDIISKKEAGSITIVGNGITENPGVMSQILGVLHKLNVPLYGMSADQGSLVMYLDQGGVERAVAELHNIVVANKETLAIARRTGLSVLRINGIGLQETPGSISRVASILRANGINIYGQYTVMSQIFLIVLFGDEHNAKKLIEKELLGDDYEK
ncbi:MAG: hypothetical protein ABII22_01150 [Candidatus Micrarchaeota archaeon]